MSKPITREDNPLLFDAVFGIIATSIAAYRNARKHPVFKKIFSPDDMTAHVAGLAALKFMKLDLVDKKTAEKKLAKDHVTKVFSETLGFDEIEWRSPVKIPCHA